jgi:hypothetical protein
MAEPRRDRVLRPTPAKIVLPAGTQPWVRDYIRSVETWTRDAEIAVRDLQERVKALEDAQTDAS